MSVKRDLLTVTRTLSASTPSDHLHANVTKATEEMERVVKVILIIINC